MPEIFRFGATVCVVGPSWVVTTLPSGAEIHAHPQGDVGQRETAAALGYGNDLAAMTRDHDVTHAWLAHAIGLPVSLALSATAGETVDPDLTAIEEEAALAVQRLCRATGCWPWRT